VQVYFPLAAHAVIAVGNNTKHAVVLSNFSAGAVIQDNFFLLLVGYRPSQNSRIDREEVRTFDNFQRRNSQRITAAVTDNQPACKSLTKTGLAEFDISVFRKRHMRLNTAPGQADSKRTGAVIRNDVHIGCMKTLCIRIETHRNSCGLSAGN